MYHLEQDLGILCVPHNVSVSCDTHSKYGFISLNNISRLEFVVETEFCVCVGSNDFIFSCFN